MTDTPEVETNMNPSGEDAQNDDAVETETAAVTEESSANPSAPQQNGTETSSKADTDAVVESENTTTTSSSSSSSSKAQQAQREVSLSPPPKPPKRARTAYFIFADSVRPQVQKDHQGVAAQAKAIGAKWQTLDDTEKEKYKQLAQQEKESNAKALQDYHEKYGSLLETTTTTNTNHSDSNDLIFPVARIRKIAKLDPEVKTLSKEALQLVVKSAELALAKLGAESVKVARLENRRTLMAQDVAHVCSHREAFRFLKDDLKDLTKALLEQKKNNHQANEIENKTGKNQALAEAASGTKPLTSYFGAATK